jgi:hypothetical protein
MHLLLPAVVPIYLRSAQHVIIILAERRPLLDIGLPQSSPRRSVLRCPRPAASRVLHQVVDPPCRGPTNAASPGAQSQFEALSAPTAVSPPHCHLRSAIRRVLSVTLDLLRISSFLIRSHFILLYQSLFHSSHPFL